MEEPEETVVQRIVREILGSPSTSNANVTFHGATNWQLTSAMTAAVLGVAFGVFGMYTAKDTKDQARIDQLKTEQDMFELRQDIKAIRAYINAGMVQPKREK